MNKYLSNFDLKSWSFYFLRTGLLSASFTIICIFDCNFVWFLTMILFNFLLWLNWFLTIFDLIDFWLWLCLIFDYDFVWFLTMTLFDFWLWFCLIFNYDFVWLLTMILFDFWLWFCLIFLLWFCLIFLLWFCLILDLLKLSPYCKCSLVYRIIEYFSNIW